jgi:predicted membrane-bound spermidine synthase
MAMRKINVQGIFFGAALFLSSAGGLVVEIVAGRLIAPYVGMSLYTWTAIIAVVLAGLSIGHWIGGSLAKSGVSQQSLANKLSIALALACISSLASLVLIRLVSGPLMTSGFGPVLVVVLLASVLFLLPSLFVGIVAPIITKLAIDDNPTEPGPVIGRMYAIGTLGSIAGTLSAGYFFISWIGSIGTILTVAAIYGILAILFAFSNRLSRGFLSIVLLGLLVGGTFLSGKQIRAFDSPCTKESDYFCIRVDDFTPIAGRASALMALDHLVHSINDRDNPTFLFSPYVQFVDEYTRRRIKKDPKVEPFSAYFIGGGGYSLPRAWAQSFQNASLLIAEIDPEVTAVARDRMWFDDTLPAIDIRHRDGRELLQSLPQTKRFDVIFGDAFHDIAIPTHLVTREFHREILKHMRPAGIYTVNVVDQGGEPLFLASLVRTLRLDFSHVEVWAGVEELSAAIAGVGQRVTYNVVASNTKGQLTRLSSRSGPERLWVQWPLEEIFKRVGENTSILTDDFAPVDRLMLKLLLAPENPI